MTPSSGDGAIYGRKLKAGVLKAGEVCARTVKHKLREVLLSEKPLPVAGIDSEAAQVVLFGLRRWLTTEEGAKTTEAWVQALQIAQIASDRLLRDLGSIQRALNFWRGRLAAGSHGSFLMFSQGPGQFASDALSLMKLRPAHAAPSDRMQEKVVVLQALSGQVARALAEVHAAADGLRLVQPVGGVARLLHHNQLLRLVQLSILTCVKRLAAALERVSTEADQWQQQPAAQSRVEEITLRQTLTMRVRGADLDAAASGNTSADPASSLADASLEAIQEQLQLLTKLLTSDPQAATASAQEEADSSDRPPMLQPLPSGASVCYALQQAFRVAAAQGPLVLQPAWAAMPSHYQRHWIKYTLGAGTLAAGVWWVYRHSRLSGSTDLEDWAAEGASTLQSSWRVHVIDPLIAVRDELFKTFRERPSIVSASEFTADKESLLRMLESFEADRPAVVAAAAAGAGPAAPSPAPAAQPSAAAAAGSSTDGATAPAAAAGSSSSVAIMLATADQEAIARGMSAVMLTYEDQLKNPIRHLVAGDLARTLLIQVQRLKLDTEAAMLELDQILKANELSISLMAAVPSMLLLSLTIRALWQLLVARPPPDPKREAAPCRLAVLDLEAALIAAIAEQAAYASSSKSGTPPADAPPHPTPEVGMVVFQVNRVYQEGQRVFRLRDRSSKYSEWPRLMADMLQLSQPKLPLQNKTELLQRLLRSYALLQA